MCLAAEVGTSKSWGGVGLHNKPHRLRCIQDICSRAYAPGPNDEEEEVTFCDHDIYRYSYIAIA
jgi:hypothetical protein